MLLAQRAKDSQLEDGFVNVAGLCDTVCLRPLGRRLL